MPLMSANSWFVRWKLLGEPADLPLHMLLNIPREAFDAAKMYVGGPVQRFSAFVTLVHPDTGRSTPHRFGIEYHPAIVAEGHPLYLPRWLVPDDDGWLHQFKPYAQLGDARNRLNAEVEKARREGILWE